MEVKLKLTAEERTRLRQALHRLGATPLKEERHEDAYYEHPCRRFSETDEALRLRCRSFLREDGRGVITELTYKGPKLDALTKTRVESSTGIEDHTAAHTILTELGFTLVARIRKKREVYQLEGTTIGLDSVDELGHFVEFERIVEAEEEIDVNRNRLLAMVSRLGLDPANSIRESYLELYLSRRAG